MSGPSWEIRTGDALALLREMPAESVHCCVTSPPYWGLRDYGVPGQLGLEATPEEYVARMVEVFREARRVLRADGTCWINLGDSYAGSRAGEQGAGGQMADRSVAAVRCRVRSETRVGPSLKPKDLVGVPWRVAFALQADGWWLRSDIIWAKPNPMPESVRDRPTKAHEYVFLLTKSERYHYDADAVAEPGVTGDLRRPYGSPGANALDVREVPQGQGRPRAAGVQRKQAAMGQQHGGYLGSNDPYATRNRRSVWTIPTRPYPEAHFATFPPELPEVCIKAGCPEGGTVLDPFAGAGTTGMVALRLDRSFVGLELNPTYAQMARDRIHDDAPLLNGGAA